jgi:MOSC domain-containing protein YiiM
MENETLERDALQLRLLALHVGRPQILGADDYSDKPWVTGFLKERVEQPLHLKVPSADGTSAALDGDGQADLKYHGGPDKAVCVYAAEHYPFWREELGFHPTLSDAGPFAFGAFGENFTIGGAQENDVCIGDVFAVGDGEDVPLLQISQPRQPCWKVARRWQVKDLAWRIQQNGRTGWYFRVLREGIVTPGMELYLTERSYPQWSVARANDIMHHQKSDREVAGLLAACPALSGSWKRTLGERAAKGDGLDVTARLGDA